MPPPTPTLSGGYLTLLLAGVFGMVLLSVALVVFFVVYQRRLFAQERARRETERLHQRDLLAAAVAVQETERRRIARDLHDDIGSLLSATRLYLRQLRPDSPPDRLTAIKSESLGILDDMIRNTRRITHDLLPAELEKFGFVAAAEDLCDRVDRGGEIAVSFSNPTTDERRLSPEREIALYRVLQELINNTLKHAEASRVEVLAHHAGDGFTFRYRDDGVGFDPAAAGGGLGLRNIESRVSLVGGTLAVDTAPGRGLDVLITLPPAPKPS